MPTPTPDAEITATPVTAITHITVSMTKEAAYQLYYDIDRVLSAASVPSFSSRTNLDVPRLYQLYDALYECDVIS